MARFGQLFTKKLYLPDSKLKGQTNKMSVVSATASELNTLDGAGVDLSSVTASTAELNLLDGGWASFTTATTPASGTCAIQLVFKDAAGVAMTNACVGTVYAATSAAGTAIATITSLAALTNGVVTIGDTGAAKYYKYITDATGKLGFTLTAAAATYYLIFEHPTKGIVVPSGACVVNA
jgi:hypothetical protein